MFQAGLVLSPYDSRDFKFNVAFTLGAMKIPLEYEQEKVPFIYDQGNTQMCCACAYNSIRYMQEHDSSQSSLEEPLSPCFTYGDRDANENYEGMMIRNCLSKGVSDGSVLLKELPDFTDVNHAIALVNNRKEELLDKANAFTIDSYYVCSSRRDIQLAILAAKGVITGIPIYDSLYDVDNTGIVNYDPTKDIQNYGGHAVAIVGWKYINSTFHWIVLNSWGNSWGDDGYCYLPESYPWIENAYAIIDNHTKETYKDYMTQYYQQ